MKEKNNFNDEELEKEPLFSNEDLEKELNPEELKKKGSKISDTWIYTLFVRSAYRLLHKPLTVFRILKQAVARLQKYENVREFAADAKERLQIIIRMVQAYAKGDYRAISKTNAALSLAGILYFLSPIDLIPDFLPLGLLDDLALLTWVYYNFQGEIESFLEWEEENSMVRIEIKNIENK